MPLSGTFTFVKIPSDVDQPVDVIEGDRSGGLEKDALVQHAKDYFHVLTGAKDRASTLEQASPEERKVLADQIRQQLSSSSGESPVRQLDDDAVLDMIYKSQSQPSCDIMAVTIPCAGNNYEAVSLYSADRAKDYGLPANDRATALLVACGHTGQVFGDAFVGRAHDNEASDVWKRTDFTVADADSATAEWCRTARQRGGGGGSGTAAASSLSGLIQQQMTGGNGASPNIQALDTGGSESPNLYGLNGAPPVIEPWGSWTQTDSEIELKLPVASGTKAKYCKITFGRTQLKVVVAGQTLVQGNLFDPVPPDECTYTIQDAETGGGRELCVTLYKMEPRTWPLAVVVPAR